MCKFSSDKKISVFNRCCHAKTGEWWDVNPIDVVRAATRTGAAPNVSDAITVNGQPGDLYKCSSKGNKRQYQVVTAFTWARV
jgi:hypothetical protein